MHYRACTCDWPQVKCNRLAGHAFRCCGKIFVKTFKNEIIIANQPVDGRGLHKKINWHTLFHTKWVFPIFILIAEFSSTRALSMLLRQPKIFLDILIHRQCHHKSLHAMKAVTWVAPNGVSFYCSSWYQGSTSDVVIVWYSKKSKNVDLILDDNWFTIHDHLTPTKRYLLEYSCICIL